MIVRFIRVADWRCFLGETEVGPFDDGLNIIHAPNTTGKSTLFEALRRALIDGHRVAGKDVEAIRPWGRHLAPKVCVEFMHGGEGYRIKKQFLDNPSALLERKEGGRYQRLAEGVSADEKTREVLTKNPPGRGLAREENWGLAQVLWAPQGNPTVGPLSSDLVSAIRTMLSAQVSGPGTGLIEKRIEEQYLSCFSAKGRLKTGKEAPPLVRLQERLAEAVGLKIKAYERHVAFEEASRRVEELRARRAQARRDAEETAKALRQARADAEKYRSLVAERERHCQQVNATEAQYKELKQRIDLIKSTGAEWDQARMALAELEKEAPLKQREVLERQKDAARRKAALEDARKGREAVDAAMDLADAARRFNECRRELRRMDERIATIEKAQGALAESRRRRGDLSAPDGKTIRSIRKAIKDRDEAQVRIEASLVRLEIVPLKDGSLEVLEGEKPGVISLRAGVPAQVQGSPAVVADLPRVARLRAWGPAGSVEEHRNARSKAEEKIRELAEPFGTADPDVLDALAEKAKELDGKVAEAETQLRTLMSGRPSDDLLQEHRSLAASNRRVLDLHPDWEHAPPNADLLSAGAEEAKHAFITAVEAAEAAWEKAQGALTAAAGQRDTLTRRTEDAVRLATGLEKRLAELTEDGKSPRERDGDLQRVAMAWEAARGALAGTEDRLGPYTYDPTAVVERLETQMEAVSDESDRAREQQLKQEANLEMLSAEGPYSVLAVAEGHVAQLEEELRRETLRVEAVRLLYESVSRCRSEAVAAVSKPVETAATRTLQRIAGRRLGEIRVGEAFEPSAVVPESAGQPVTLDNLSGGEQEQLYLATRLALAEVLAKEDRQLVVLDDVLTATDTGRAARVMNVLEEAAERLQVLILTCHPERYLGLKAARFFDLEALSAAGKSN